MAKSRHLLRQRIVPLLLGAFVILATLIYLNTNHTMWLYFIALMALVFGFWMGNITNPAVSYRKKKVKKQNLDLIKLNEQFKIHSAAMESAANGIIITDTRGKIEWVNPAFGQLTGYTLEESVGMSLNILNSGVHDKEFFKELWQTVLQGKVWHNEIVNKRKDGSHYTEEMTITPVNNEKGELKNFVAIKQDVSERKRLEEISILEKKRMETELDVARNIQMSLLRKNLEGGESLNDVDIFARLIPAREVGGDFYDYFWIDDERLCFVIGDVSGKGVPAALFMAVTKTLLKSTMNITRSVSQTMTQVNNEISKDNENFMFITVFMGILNTTTGYLTYSNAGHNPSYILKPNENKLEALNELHGVVIGAMENIQYKETVVRMNRGDSVFVYTDGITEARNQQNDLFSDARLIRILDSKLKDQPGDLVNHIFAEVKQHENGAEPADDITVLNIHFKEQTSGSLVDYLFTNLSNQMESVHQFANDFTEFAKKHEMGEEAVQQLKIVFDELLSNIVKYAYADEEKHEMEVKVRYYGQKLTVTILDDGQPFNPFESPEVDTSLNVPEREVGGLGIHLVKFFVDDYEYEYNTQINKNSTHFVKNLS